VVGGTGVRPVKPVHGQDGRATSAHHSN
jgi:hypothetical protein